MRGISLDELYEKIAHFHDAEFVYKGATYVLQPEVDKGKTFLVIWDCTDNAKCICKREINNINEIPKSVIDSVLQEKCFDGKSFLELEKEISVTVIY